MFIYILRLQILRNDMTQKQTTFLFIAYYKKKRIWRSWWLYRLACVSPLKCLGVRHNAISLIKHNILTRPCGLFAPKDFYIIRLSVCWPFSVSYEYISGTHCAHWFRYQQFYLCVNSITVNKGIHSVKCNILTESNKQHFLYILIPCIKLKLYLKHLRYFVIFMGGLF